MAEKFDPYHKWLAIPPEEQPANHYRLLGLRLFESDPDVIASAADRQMAHVRSFQSGQHAALSQRLLNEISAARVCLLKPQKKAAYDAALQAELAEKQPTGHSTSEAEDYARIGIADIAASSSDRQSHPVRKKKQSWQLPVAVAIGAGLVIGMVIFLFSGGGGDKKKVAQPETKGSGSGKTLREQPSPKRPSASTAQSEVKPGVKPKPPAAEEPAAEGMKAQTPEQSKPDAQPKAAVAPETSAGPATADEPKARVAGVTKAAAADAGLKGDREGLSVPKVETTTKAAPGAGPTDAVGWNELLQDVDLGKGKIEGQWQREGKALRASSKSESNVPLPIVLENKSYDLRIEFTRNVSGGSGSIQIGLPVGSRLCTLALAGWNDTASTLAAIDGQDAYANATRRPGTIAYGKRHTVLARVRLEHDAVSVEITLDGQPYLRWSGREGQISVPGWSHPPFLNRPALGGGYCDVTYHSAAVRIEPATDADSAEGDSENETVAGRAKAVRKSPPRVAALLRKKLRGKVFYDAKARQFSLVYDWASKAQLQDFDLSNANVTFARGALSLRGGESVRHVVDFKEVTVAVPVLVPQMRGTLIHTTGGTRAYLGGAFNDAMYLDPRSPQGARGVENGGGQRVCAIVPAGQRKGLQLIQFAVTAKRLGFSYGLTRVSAPVEDSHAGQVELFGGDAGYQFGKLVLTGTMDEKWLKSYVED